MYSRPKTKVGFPQRSKESWSSPYQMYCAEMGSAPAATPRAAEICCTCICAPRWSNRDDESILFKLSEDDEDKVIVAFAVLPLKDDDRPVDSWKG